jgi:putative transposase
VIAGLCADPADWRWSSYAATVGLAPRPPFLTVDLLLGHFAPSLEAAQNRYRAFVVRGLSEAGSTGRLAA